MNIEEYQTIIEKTAIYPKNIGLAYCALGLTGEAGEVAEKIKKFYRDSDYQDEDGNVDLHWLSKDIPPQFKKDVVKELGDVIWYVTAMANELGVSLSEVLDVNYNKLLARRKTNTLQGSGDDREEGELKNLYDSLEQEEDEPVYLGDGVYIDSEGNGFTQ